MLPFHLDAVIDDWNSLRPAMIRTRPEAFTRPEWAYLLEFLAPENLRMPFERAFGTPCANDAAPPRSLFRPGGPVAVWLPNNVSLLGPLTAILLSLTGNPVHFKAGSRGQDLASAFLDYVLGTLRDGHLKEHLRTRYDLAVFERDDPRNADMAREAAVRIVFGSDAAVEAVEALPHPPGSVGCCFGDRRSQAWLEPAALNDAVVTDLLRVFAIYGQAGCTSPSKVVLLTDGGGLASSPAELCARLSAGWPQAVRRDPPMHVASQNVLAAQWGKALGWEASLAARNGAVFAAGTPELPAFAGPMTLPVVAMSVEEAIAQLPANIQTLGHAFADPSDPRWLSLLADTRIKRLVPLARMHHFGAVWEGRNFWKQTFEEIDISP